MAGGGRDAGESGPDSPCRPWSTPAPAGRRARGFLRRAGSVGVGVIWTPAARKRHVWGELPSQRRPHPFDPFQLLQRPEWPMGGAVGHDPLRDHRADPRKRVDQLRRGDVQIDDRDMRRSALWTGRFHRGGCPGRLRGSDRRLASGHPLLSGGLRARSFALCHAGRIDRGDREGERALGGTARRCHVATADDADAGPEEDGQGEEQEGSAFSGCQVRLDGEGRRRAGFGILTMAPGGQPCDIVWCRGGWFYRNT